MIETPLRPRIDLDLDWDFVRRRVGRSWLIRGSADAERVDLPHCWNADDTFQYGRRSHAGWGAYRKPLPPIDRALGDDLRWQFRTGGFYGVGDLWIDGRRQARVDGQYLGLGLQLPHAAAESGCILGLRLDNRFHPHVLPGRQDPDFLLYGGLAGRAWLEGLPAIHFDAEGVRLMSRTGDDGHEEITVHWRLQTSAAPPRRCGVRWRIEDSRGRVLDEGEPQHVEGDEGHRHDLAAPPLRIGQPRCWRPDDPVLYRAVGHLLADGELVDVIRVRFGITRVEFRPREGLYLDGHRVDLRGCNRHESIPGLGSALPDELHRSDARLLKELGCNFVRLSHYPQAPAFLDACDELGILVQPEIATWKSVTRRRRWLRAARRQMRDMIRRDRHHPSILLWGMGNESRSRTAYLELRAVVGELDAQRPVTYAENHLYRARRKKTVGIPDVWGLNYELDVLTEACGASRLENVIVTECCKNASTVRGSDHDELVQAAVVTRDWEALAGHPFVCGYSVWSFSDYGTEHRSRYRSLSGLMDAWRLPKMAAELFRARYGDRPFVTLFVTESGLDLEPSPYRQILTGDPHGPDHRQIHVFTNCETVRLTCDGSSLGEFEGALHYVLPLYGDCQQLLATGSRDGTVVQSTFRQHGDPFALDIAAIEAARGSIVPVDLAVRDRAGVTVANWSGSVLLTVSGGARLRTIDGGGLVQMARGIGRTYLQLRPDARDVMLAATDDGLVTATVTVQLGG